MKINSITSYHYNKNQCNQLKTSKHQNSSNLSFRGGKGAGVGSALGTAAVAWIGGAALAAMGPLALLGGMAAGFVGGAITGHGVEEVIDAIEKDDKNDNGD